MTSARLTRALAQRHAREVAADARRMARSLFCTPDGQKWSDFRTPKQWATEIGCALAIGAAAFSAAVLCFGWPA